VGWRCCCGGRAGAGCPRPPARAQTWERILGYTVDLRIEAAGTLLATEQIAYDFGAEERHGSFRDIPVRFPYDDATTRSTPADAGGLRIPRGTPDQ
jgi:hypothetical protein